MSVMTAFVQAFVWATIVGFLYISWVNNQVDSPITVFERSRKVTQVLQPLQSLWIAIGLCLIIALVLPALFPLLQIENNVSTSCITAPPQVVDSFQADYSTAMVCPPSPSTPAHSDGSLHIANGGKMEPHSSP
jgi:hypothetical protein